MKRALTFQLPLLLLALTLSVPVIAQSKPNKDKKFSAVVVDAKDQKTTLKDASIRAGQSLFSSGAGKKEIEVKKDGGKLEIKVPFSKIAKLKVTDVNDIRVVVEITSVTKAVLKGHIATNLEIVGTTEFGEGSIRLRDVKTIELKAE